jgi:aryl-alcohol dehydrogenase-like predicted oxidoreductase
LAGTGGYGPADEAECSRAVRHALDIGVTMIDTADFHVHVNSGAALERLIGRALGRCRDQAIIATRPSQAPIGGLRRACDVSLRQLGVEHVDLYYLPRVDQLAPIEALMGELAELVQAGKVRYAGLSQPSAQQLRRAHAVHPVTALACEYAVWERRAEAELLPAARALGVGIVACRPLGRGFLTGRIARADQLAAGDYRRGDPRFSPESIARNQGPLRAAEQLAAQLDVGLSRLALAWLLSQAPDVVPIPSTRNLLHLEMNAAAAQVRLTRADQDRLAELFPPTPPADPDPR